MDQSEMGNPTAPYDSSVMPTPELRKGDRGWSGKGWTTKGETWRVVDNVIKIKFSDADPSRVPTPEQRIRTVDEEGNFSHHVLMSEDHELYQLWMRKIGPYLGDWVLGKGRYGAHYKYPPLTSCIAGSY